jgi:ABC-2 type transport system ATP-binding protein
VLERFNLTDAADRPVKTYSGGMRRRLDLGASLVGDPPVLILDEPTTGLDPRSRADVWGFIEAMVAEGTTVLLTTQYLEEADRLAHKIVVIDLGKVIAEGTSSELKDQLGGNVLVAQVSDGAQLDKVVALLGDLGLGTPAVDRDARRVTVPARTGTEVLIEAARRVGDAGVELDDLAISRPSLDDVFLALTGHGASGDEQASGNGSQPPARGRRARSKAAS